MKMYKGPSKIFNIFTSVHFFISLPSLLKVYISTCYFIPKYCLQMITFSLKRWKSTRINFVFTDHHPSSWKCMFYTLMKMLTFLDSPLKQLIKQVEIIKVFIIVIHYPMMVIYLNQIVVVVLINELWPCTKLTEFTIKSYQPFVGLVIFRH